MTRKNEAFEVLNEISSSYCGKQVYALCDDKSVISALTGKTYPNIHEATLEFCIYIGNQRKE